MAGKPTTIRLVHNDLPRIAKALPEAVSGVLRRGTFRTEAGMRQVVPVRRGFLKGSIGTKGTAPGSLAMQVTVGMDYGPEVEYGTRRMAGRHYTRNTVAKTFPETIAELGDLERSL